MTQLIIGTAQFGMNYGIANSTGQPSESTIRAIIERATENEILYYDTAISYGSSEEVLGKIFCELGIHQQVRVFTKIPKLAGVSSLPSILGHVDQSLSRLKTHQIFGLLLHSELDHSYLEELSKISEKGLCKHIGVSVGHDALFNSELIKHPHLDLIQVPANLLDRRNLIPKILEKSGNKQTIVRSVYLQGLFSIAPGKLSEFHQPLKPLTEKLRQIAESFGIGINELALRYILAYSPDYIVIGIESVKQFQSNLTWFRKGPLKKSILDQINSISYDLDFKLITPYQWSN
jgi:aryl-alcohol dehydrogenase-like predicted oxidoreductase